MSLFGTGKYTGIVLDIGDGISQVMPVYDGYCLNHAANRIDIGGRDIT